MSYELIHDSIRDSGSEHGPGYIAQDKNGNWYWFSDNPIANLETGRWEAEGEQRFIRECDIFASSHWALSLEEI